jgi:hypothetical protein
VTEETYRSAPSRPSAASLEDETLAIPRDATLPEVCLGCGKEGVAPTHRSHEIVSPGVSVAVMFLSTFVGMRLWVTDSVTLRYAICEPCRLRTLNADQTRQGLAIAGLVVTIGLATAVFNGAFLAGAIIAVLGPGLIYAAYARFVRDRGILVIDASPLLRLRGVHPKAAEAVIEALRQPQR